MSREHDDGVPGPEITRQIYETPTMTSNNIRTVNIAILYQFKLCWGRWSIIDSTIMITEIISTCIVNPSSPWVDENKEKIKYNIMSLAGAGLVEILIKSCHYC